MTLQKANLGDDADLAEYAIKGGEKVRLNLSFKISASSMLREVSL